MAFIEELGKAIGNGSRKAANKVKDMTGILQLKSKLSAEREKINRAYISLGQAYYDKHELSVEEEFANEFKIIGAGLVKIAALEDEIAELEGARVCAECGSRVERSAMYCSRCGALMGECAPQSGDPGRRAAAEQFDFTGKDGQNGEQEQ
ncbi:zinc ribbon domain-containing protein [Clostridiaceae bacterium]|jgi:hypothetical protein|nr:zinc ribbon domain-containing protein [Clostridium sp.]NBI70244.1 zinc ribbon domain-containing protein [Clostridiaceae bacterium]